MVIAFRRAHRWGCSRTFADGPRGDRADDVWVSQVWRLQVVRSLPERFLAKSGVTSDRRLKVYNPG
jgi:hypothetical protein